MSIQQISLSGRKMEVSNKEMTFLESLYLVAIVKGLLITIKHFFLLKNYYLSDFRVIDRINK